MVRFSPDLRAKGGRAVMTAASVASARFLRVRGVVQGVGFRPFVYRIARRHSIAGWVRNVAGTVEIHAEGLEQDLDRFQRALRSESPAVSHVETVEIVDDVFEGREVFEITVSVDSEGLRPITPDLAICADCESELFDPRDRRYRHPFITCTNCGPRYTIVHSLPYDRERTSMSPFRMCRQCDAEYESPGDRRYHAETVACRDCGPGVWLERADGVALAGGDAAIRSAAAKLVQGSTVAIRGVGGFHLACDATDEAAVLRLRERKQRDSKPFAVMVRNAADARTVAVISTEEERLLESVERPVVILPVRDKADLASSVSPGLGTVGVMIAYTPLHHLLLQAAGKPLVMTSGNRSDEPIVLGNDEALERLGGIADFFLLHDREILSRIDDSVARVVDGAPVLIRRARGYAPRSLKLPNKSPKTLLAVGPHLKNTFTLVRDDVAHVSPHVGDLDSIESLDHFNEMLARYENLFRLRPEVAVRDMHPGYLSSRIAEELGVEGIIDVQHHHAHVAAVAAEHGVTSRVVGLAFDGTGLGDDGNVWGAETLIADLCGFRRVGHLRYVPLPGGDLAAREPWRVALGYLSLEENARSLFRFAFDGIEASETAAVRMQLDRRINTPLASSMGRLFDAASAILGVRQYASFEGQAAMELESLAGSIAAPPLEFPVVEESGSFVLDPLPLLISLGDLRCRGADVCELAARFHESIVRAASALAAHVAALNGLDTVALGGGSFQNARLLSGIRSRLESRGLRVLIPRLLGPNDGAISYGQAAIAAALLSRGD